MSEGLLNKISHLETRLAQITERNAFLEERLRDLTAETEAVRRSPHPSVNVFMEGPGTSDNTLFSGLRLSRAPATGEFLETFDNGGMLPTLPGDQHVYLQVTRVVHTFDPRAPDETYSADVFVRNPGPGVIRVPQVPA